MHSVLWFNILIYPFNNQIYMYGVKFHFELVYVPFLIFFSENTTFLSICAAAPLDLGPVV